MNKSVIQVHMGWCNLDPLLPHIWLLILLQLCIFTLGLLFTTTSHIYPDPTQNSLCLLDHDVQTTLHTLCVRLFGGLCWCQAQFFQCPLLSFSLLLTGARLTTSHLACQKHWRSFPRLRYLVAELVFLCFTKPLIEDNTWSLACLKCLQVLTCTASNHRPQSYHPQRNTTLEGTEYRAETYRNAEVCKMAPIYSMRFGKNQSCCSQIRSVWSLNWLDNVVGKVLDLRAYSFMAHSSGLRFV